MYLAVYHVQVVDACVGALGASKVGIKIQQGVTFSDLVEPEDDVLAQYEYLGPALAKRKLAYVCLSSLNGEQYSRYNITSVDGSFVRTIKTSHSTFL